MLAKCEKARTAKMSSRSRSSTFHLFYSECAVSRAFCSGRRAKRVFHCLWMLGDYSQKDPRRTFRTRAPLLPILHRGRCKPGLDPLSVLW